MKVVPETDRAAGWRDAGLRLAEDLASRAVWVDHVCGFHGGRVAAGPHDPPRFGSAGADLYEGSAGIARFLGRAAVLSGDPRLADTALGAIRHALEQAQGWSLFTGSLGVGLVALELADLLDAPDLVTPAVRRIEGAAHDARQAGSPYDLLGGLAGVVVGLLDARAYDMDGGWVRCAGDLGRALLEAAVDEGPTIEDDRPRSWPLAAGSAERLCGLAHGASGVALAFEALARVCPAGGPWRAAARSARAFERAHYAPSHGSWADLREREIGAPLAYPHMWCHGSVGIVAERLHAMVDDPLARADAAGGLAGAAGHARRLLSRPAGPGADDRLNGSACHGLAGLIDVMIDAWQATADTVWSTLAGELADLLLNDARRIGGWRSGLRGGWPAPGLMLGDAGIGWVLLRVAQPDAVPTVWRPAPRAAGVRPELPPGQRHARVAPQS